MRLLGQWRATVPPRALEYLGCISAASRPYLGCISAVSRHSDLHARLKKGTATIASAVVVTSTKRTFASRFTCHIRQVRHRKRARPHAAGADLQVDRRYLGRRLRRVHRRSRVFARVYHQSDGAVRSEHGVRPQRVIEGERVLRR